MSSGWRLGLSMVLALGIGFAYLVWLAWAEGWRLWVVLGVMALVGLIGGSVHVAMGMARQRDGLEKGGPTPPGGDDDGSSVPPAARPSGGAD